VRASTVLVVANRVDADPGYIGERFAERGCTLTTRLREEDELVLGDASVLLLLGSEWSAAEPVAPEVLDAECALVRDAVKAGVPVLGLCYGAQVIATALGGRVAHAPEPEIGLVEVETVDESLVPSGPWWEFHLDVINPPPGSSVVARNGCGIQAFVTDKTLGVQFHPEVLPETLDDWASRYPRLVIGAGTTREDIVARARAAQDRSRRAAHHLVDAFLDRFAD
jgi:GMP synthase-like glutamine amidotransferase